MILLRSRVWSFGANLLRLVSPRLYALQAEWRSRFKKRVLRHYGLPLDKHGLPACLLDRLPKRPLTVIDIGASSGDFTEAIRRARGIKQAILIEPQPKRIDELRTRFKDKSITVVGCAVADKEGIATVEILNWDYSSSLLPVRRDLREVTRVLDLGVRDTIQCKVCTLDDIVAKLDFATKVDLLKIDVQGAEHLVLRGAIKTLPRVKAIWTEVSFRPLYVGSSVITDICDLCRNFGFGLVALDDAFRGDQNELLQVNALFVRLGASGANAVAEELSGLELADGS